MKHKHKKPKHQRAGCLMCKPHKDGRENKNKLGHTGFGKLRKLKHADDDLEEYINKGENDE